MEQELDVGVTVLRNGIGVPKLYCLFLYNTGACRVWAKLLESRLSRNLN